MGKIKVTSDCNGIEGLKVIEPAVFGDAEAISWKHTTTTISKNQALTVNSYRTTSLLPPKVF